MENLSSIFLYAVVAAVCLIAASRIKNRPRVNFWFIVIVLTLLAGLRHQSVGIDTTPYVDLLSPLRDGFSWRLGNINEPGFLLLSYLLVNISSGYTLMLTVYAFIINYFVIKRLYELRKEISFPWALFIFIMQYYFTTFNTIRQWIAMAILFYFSKYIPDGKKGIFKFIVAIVIATTFHKTALIMIALIPIFYLMRKSRTVVHQIIKIGMILAAPVVFSALLSYMQKNYGDSYGNVSSTHDISVIAIVRLAFLFLIVILSCLDAKRRRSAVCMLEQDKNLLKRTQDAERLETTIAVVGAMCTLMVFFYRYADRLGTYFMMFEMIVYPRYIKNSCFKKIVVLFVFLIFMFLRIMSFKANGYGEMPYLAFWQ